MLHSLPQTLSDWNDLTNFTLDELARRAARCFIAHALRQEAGDYVDRHADLRDDKGHRLVVRNGYGKERKLTLGAGTITLKAPRVNDRRQGFNFSSNILPSYLRRSLKVSSAIAVLYLLGISGNDMEKALKALLGDDAKSLSKSTISLLKKAWLDELQEWRQKPIEEEFVYLWVDGVNINVRV